MDRRGKLVFVFTAFVAAALLFVSMGGFGLLPAGEYERTAVTVVDEDGTTLATVDVRVADTFQKRYTGLSDTDSLDADEGMLFVHDEEGEYAYVMRDMAFPLDIVFIAADGTVTRIHRAPLPPEGTESSELTRYRGTGRYVLEVPYGYTNETGIGVGDSVRIAGEWGPSQSERKTHEDCLTGQTMHDAVAALAQREGWRAEGYAARVHYSGAGDRYSVEYYAPSDCLLYWKVKGDGETAVPVGRESVPDPLRKRVRADLAAADVDPAVEERNL